MLNLIYAFFFCTSCKKLCLNTTCNYHMIIEVIAYIFKSIFFFKVSTNTVLWKFIKIIEKMFPALFK